MFVAFVKHFEIRGQKGSVRVVSSKREKAVKLRSEVILIFLCLFPLSNILSIGKRLLIAK